MSTLLACLHHSAQLTDIGNATWLLPYCCFAAWVLMWEAWRE